MVGPAGQTRQAGRTGQNGPQAQMVEPAGQTRQARRTGQNGPQAQMVEPAGPMGQRGPAGQRGAAGQAGRAAEPACRPLAPAAADEHVAPSPAEPLLAYWGVFVHDAAAVAGGDAGAQDPAHAASEPAAMRAAWLRPNRRVEPAVWPAAWDWPRPVARPWVVSPRARPPAPGRAAAVWPGPRPLAPGSQPQRPDLRAQRQAARPGRPAPPMPPSQVAPQAGAPRWRTRGRGPWTWPRAKDRPVMRRRRHLVRVPDSLRSPKKPVARLRHRRRTVAPLHPRVAQETCLVVLPLAEQTCLAVLPLAELCAAAPAPWHLAAALVPLAAGAAIVVLQVFESCVIFVAAPRLEYGVGPPRGSGAWRPRDGCSGGR